MSKIGISLILTATLVLGANTKTYSQEDMDRVLERLNKLEKLVGNLSNIEKVIDEKDKKLIKQIEELEASTDESLDELHERADENEFQATMNRINWGGEFELTDNFLKGESGSISALGLTGNEYENKNHFVTKLRLSMEAKINDKTRFTGRLSMYKNWSDYTGNDLREPLQGRKPVGSTEIFVERAYVDYSLRDNIILTLGRQPSSDGPGMTLIENTQRKATYPSVFFDAAADGIVGSYKILPDSDINPTVRAVYGKVYQTNPDYSIMQELEIKDLVVYALFYEMNLPIKSMGENLFILSYIKGTDFIGYPTGGYIEGNKNLGDMDFAGIYFENNRAFGTNFNYFISTGVSMPKSNGKTINFGAITKNQNVGLIDKDGYVYHIGARYDFDSGFKLGYEFNKGSKHWYSFTVGSSDLLNKLATRGTANEFYLMYQLDMYQFLKLGYTMIDYDYTGSSVYVGTPMKTDDFVDRAYATYNLRF